MMTLLIRYLVMLLSKTGSKARPALGYISQDAATIPGTRARRGSWIHFCCCEERGAGGESSRICWTGSDFPMRVPCSPKPSVQSRQTLLPLDSCGPGDSRLEPAGAAVWADAICGRLCWPQRERRWQTLVLAGYYRNVRAALQRLRDRPPEKRRVRRTRRQLVAAACALDTDLKTTWTLAGLPQLIRPLTGQHLSLERSHDQHSLNKGR